MAGKRGSGMTESEIVEILDDIWTFGHEPTDKERLAANKAIDLIQELQQYRAIGTVEECREARERQRGKKPTYEGDGYADGELVYDTWICPNCGEYYETDYDDYIYCPNCGQAIDLSEVN